MSERMPPIRAELVAAKIEQILNFEQPELFDEITANPRFISTLWALAFFSQPENYAGGLTKFSHDLIERGGADQIGTPTIAKVGQVERYSASEAIAILRELTQIQREELFDDDFWLFENAFAYGDPGAGTLQVGRERARWLFDEGEEPFAEEHWSGTRVELEQLLINRLTPARARNICLEEAQSGLAGYFKRLCEQPHIGSRPHDGGNGAPNYFARVSQALLEFIDQRAAALRETLAETAVTQFVFRWMGKARTMKMPIMISGNSRFGKSESAKLLCQMEPGTYRHVETPDGNAISDLLREVAKALGIEVSSNNALRDLRERIDYVLRFANLVLVFDEFQAALPASFSRNTVPARLNWVRRSVIDQGVAVVLICTPQSYLRARDNFVRTTKFAMEQFDERILKKNLPSELSKVDLLAVARIHFADLSEEYLQFVVEAALATERNYVSDISKIAALAKDNASENGRERPLLCDIDAAIADVLPAPPVLPAVPEKRRTSIAVPIPPPCTKTARPLQEPRISPATLPESRREMTQLAVKI